MYKPVLPSNKKFGFLFSGIFCLLGCINYLQWGSGFALYSCFVASLVMAVVSMLAPEILTKLNKAWFSVGQAMGKFANPLVLGIIFYLIITPVAILNRFFGRDELRLRKKSEISYWVDRDTPEAINPEYFKNQY